MKDFVIDACRWQVDAEAKQYKKPALEHFRDRSIVLLTFLRTEGLLRVPDFGQNVKDWLKFTLRASDLTENGVALVKLCHGSWNPAFGQGHTQRHLQQWK